MSTRKRWLKLVAAVGALSLMAAACGDDDEDDAGEDPETTEGTEGTEAEGGGDGPLTIGVLFPESGSLNAIVGALRTPVDMAIEEINAAGGVLGQDVGIAAADDGTDDTNLARTGLERLVSSDGINVLLGPASSTLTEALMEDIVAADVVACSGSNTAASLEEIEDEGRYFGFAPNDNLQGPALAEVIAGDGHASVGILVRNDTYGTGFGDAIAGGLDESGVEVAIQRAYDPDSSTGYAADVQAVLDAQPDAVALIGFGTDGAQVLSEMIEQGAGPGTLPIYTGDGMQSSTFWETVNSQDPTAVQGIKGTAPAAAPSGVEHPFTENYAETGEDTIFSAYYYDCAMVTALAAEAAGSTEADAIAEAIPEVTSEGTECQTFADCKALLDEGEDIDYQGASGDLTLNDAGHVVSGAYDVWEYDAEGAPTTLDVPQIVISREE